MGRRTDIRRIGAIMRHGGADGSLVAWVEAELERVDFRDPVPGCLATLVDDLTARERQLIVGALLTVALQGDAVQASGLDAAVRIGRELGIDVVGVEHILREVSGWSMAQARALASRGLPASTHPAALAEAQRGPSDERHLPVSERTTLRGKPPAAPATHGGDGPPSLPLLDEVHFELPELTEAGDEDTASGADEITHAGERTEPVRFVAREDRDADDRASVPPGTARPDPSASLYDTDRLDELAAVQSDDDLPIEDALDEDPPTVEMTPDAVRALLRRQAQDREALHTPPRFSALGSVLDDRLPESDAPPTTGMENDPASTQPDDIAPVPLEQGLRDLPPLDWGDGDAFTVNEFTLSERIAEERFDEDDPADAEPTRFSRVPREVQRLIARADRQEGRREPTVELPDLEADDDTGEASDVGALSPEDLMPDPDALSLGELELDDTPPARTDGIMDLELDPPRRADGAMDLDLDEDPLPRSPDGTMDLDPDDDDLGDDPSLPGPIIRELDLEREVSEEEPSLPGPSVEELHLDADFLEPPPSDRWARPDAVGPSTAELLDLDLDDAPMGALDRALRTTGPLPARPDPSQDLRTGEALRAAPYEDAEELSLDPDQPELSLDPDTGERIAVAGRRAVDWSPPEEPQRPPASLPSLDDDVLTPELQPLEQGLADYWSPQPLHLSDGLTGELHPVDARAGLTGELQILDPGDVQGGLTGELRVLDPGDVQGGLTGELRVLDPGDVQEGLTAELVYDDEQDGLTGELRPVRDARPPRRAPRNGRRGSDGITQDLTLLVDGNPDRRNSKD